MAALLDADTGGNGDGDGGGSVMFGAGGGISAGFSNATGGGDVTDRSPQKKNVILRMNNPRSAKNGSLPCMAVTFASGEHHSTPKQNIAL
jgi:hypothetical protein